jgi:hypothetical protein
MKARHLIIHIVDIIIVDIVLASRESLYENLAQRGVFDRISNEIENTLISLITTFSFETVC